MCAEGRSWFGALLRRYRATAGLSQEALAERAGLSRRGIADLERGARQYPHGETVRRLADALGLDLVARADLVTAARRVSAPIRTGLAPSGGTPYHNLPASVTTCVGREKELIDVQARLASGGC